MSDTSWYVIAYDIRDVRRLRRVQRFLRSCSHVLQESVFAWEGTQRELQMLKAEIRRLIRESEDDVRGYPVCRNHGILWWGSLPMPQGIVAESAPRIAWQGAAC